MCIHGTELVVRKQSKLIPCVFESVIDPTRPQFVDVGANAGQCRCQQWPVVFDQIMASHNKRLPFGRLMGFLYQFVPSVGQSTRILDILESNPVDCAGATMNRA
jgi:hypothetical protein